MTVIKKFTDTECKEIIKLLEEKKYATKTRKKAIRAKLRKLGLYVSEHVEKGDDLITLIKKQLKSNSQRSIVDKKTADSVQVKPNRQDLTENSITTETAQPMSDANTKNGLDAWVDENSEVLILGSLPGDESIAKQSYYCNSNNQFWNIMSELFNNREKVSGNKKEFILKHKIALWDCLKSAEREGSSDSNIKSGEPNDLSSFLKNHPRIKTIIVNGKGVKEDYFDIYFKDISDKEYKIHTVTSTSGAAAKSLENRIPEWENALSGVIS